MDWILKCRECGEQYEVDNCDLPRKENPSGIEQQVCKCGGALDLVPFNPGISGKDAKEFLRALLDA